MIFLNWLDIDWHKIDTGKKLIDIDWYMIGFQILTDMTLLLLYLKNCGYYCLFSKISRCACINLVMLWNIFAVFDSRPPFFGGWARTCWYASTGSWKSNFNWYGIKLQINWSIIDWYWIIDEVNWSDIDWYIIGLKILIDYWLICYFQWWVSLLSWVKIRQSTTFL